MGAATPRRTGIMSDRMTPAAMPRAVAPVRTSAEFEIKNQVEESQQRRSKIEYTFPVNLTTHPFLADHAIDGRPVVPVVMMLEWLASAALAAHPAHRLVGFDDFRVLKGLVIAPDGPAVTIEIAPIAPSAPHAAGFACAFELAARGNDRRTLHARATVIFADRLNQKSEIKNQNFSNQTPGEHPQLDTAAADALYSTVLFHGPRFAAITAIGNATKSRVVARVRTSPPPRDWMPDPVHEAWQMDPLALDGALQLGLVWCHEFAGRIGLPSYIRSFRQVSSLVENPPAAPMPTAVASAFSPTTDASLFAELFVRDHDAQRLCGDLTLATSAGDLVARLDGVEWIVRPPPSNKEARVRKPNEDRKSKIENTELRADACADGVVLP